MNQESSKLSKLMEEVVKCPVCGEESLKISIYKYRIPYIGDVLIESAKCGSCGYRWSDVEPVRHDSPRRIVVQVRNNNGLNTLIVKSSRATILIPELGIEIYPGPAAPGYITTIEGILYRVLDHIPQECMTSGQKCHEKVELIKKAINGLIPFTLIIEDPSGRSLVRDTHRNGQNKGL